MRFRDEYYFLSNKYPCKVKFRDYEFKCAESAYQAYKNEAFAFRFVNFDGDRSKQESKLVELPFDWNNKKIKLMKEVVYSKFSQNEELKQKLINMDIDIVEDNNWHDNFWGNCNCDKCKNIVHLNYLGKILMDVREILKNE